MFFSYPIAATSENWLHESLCDAVQSIHDAIDAKEKYPGWPSVLPVAYREKLKSRPGLRDRLKAYDAAVRKLGKEERDLLLEALDGENRVPDLLSGVSECRTIEDMPESARQPVSDLFEFAFGLLTDLGVRDRQYEVIYTASAHVCPFCAVEYFDAPGAAREALDHYLTKSRYTFAAANLRNLVPMGHKCNSSYKLAKDLLRRDDGSRRVAFDPYGHVVLSLSLDGSDPFGGTTEHTPRWELTFEPHADPVSTWDEVFSVRVRYQRDHLDPSYRGWLDLFAKTARREGVRAESSVELIEALKRLEERYEDEGMRDRGFLKAAVFRMLRRHCEANNDRLLKLIGDLVSPVPMALA